MRDDQLINLRVETKSGDHLGKIVRFEVHPETQQITSYTVASQRLVAQFFGDALLIDRRQVIMITPEKMIVEDLTIPAGEKQAWPGRLSPRRASPSVS